MHLWEIVKSFSRISDIRTVLDVGSHAGGFYENVARPFIPLDGKRRYYFFEPTPTTYRALSGKFSGIPGAACFNMALGDTCGRLQFYNVEYDISAELLSMGNRVVDASEAGARPPDQLVEVECATVDSLMSTGAIEQPDFIKIDAQGYDLKVLRGARGTLSKCQFLLFEFQNDIQQMITTMTYLHGLGFELFNISMDKEIRNNTGRLIEFNLAFYKPVPPQRVPAVHTRTCETIDDKIKRLLDARRAK